MKQAYLTAWEGFDGRLGVLAPETFDTYFTNEKEFKAVKKQGLNRAFKMQVSKDTVSEVSEYIRKRLAES